jgi:hypothetical protein
MQMTSENVTWWRFYRSNLVEPGTGPEQVAENHLGIQSQIFTAASVAIAVRTESGTHADLEEQFSGQRNLVKTWGQRNTVHLYPAASVPFMVRALAEESSWPMRQYLKGGGTEQGYRALLTTASDYLHARGSCTREEMSTFLAGREPGFEAIGSWGGILIDLAKQGHLCLGGYDKEAGKQLLYSQPHWNPLLKADPATPPELAASNSMLIQKYFATYGPATLSDFCHWRGVSLSQARPWLANAQELHSFEMDRQTYYAPRIDVPRLEKNTLTAADLPPMLLYRFDPLILAHKDKDWLISEKHYKKVWRIAAHVEGVLVKQGRIVGVWKFKRKGKSLQFVVHHFRTRDKIGKRDLENRLSRIAEYLGYVDWDWVEEEY